MVARVSASTRRYRPAPDRPLRSSISPSPAAVAYRSVHAVPSPETWIRYRVAYAFSQFSLTRRTGWDRPRSIRNHWVPGPETLAQRVWLFTSATLVAAYAALCVDEASTGRFRDSSTSSAASAVTETASGTHSTTAVPAPKATTPARNLTRPS